jgi:2-phosphoglycerate kinase
MMAESDVIVIGDAPFSGKTTIAKWLAAQRGYSLVAIDDLGTAVRAVTTPQSHPTLHPMADWDYRDYYVRQSPATLIHHSMQEHAALWPAIAAVIQAHRQRAGPVILEGWQLDPERVASFTHPHLRICWLLVDEAVLETRLRADTAFPRGCTDVERLIYHYVERNRWVNDRVRRATTNEACVVVRVGANETVESVVTRCVQCLWPE